MCKICTFLSIWAKALRYELVKIWANMPKKRGGDLSTPLLYNTEN
nr:MAG TPA: hypothetical protein [Bacteriophage sp.]